MRNIRAKLLTSTLIATSAITLAPTANAMTAQAIVITDTCTVITQALAKAVGL